MPEENDKAPENLTAAILNSIWRSKFRSRMVFLAGICGAMFLIWDSAPDDDKSELISYVFGSNARLDVLVENFAISDNTDENAIWLRNKTERNTVEFLVENGNRVGHRLSVVGSQSNAYRTIKGSISRTNSTYIVDVSLHASNGEVMASTQMEGDFPTLKRYYKSIPEALLYGMDVDPSKMVALESKTRPTSSVEAFASYLEARRLASMGRLDEAIELVDLAISEDHRFAMAHWGKGQLYELIGDEGERDNWLAKALELDQDHPRLPIHTNVSDPMPTLMENSKNTAWNEINLGVKYKEVHAGAYDVIVHAWSFDQRYFEVRVDLQTDPAGSSVDDLRQKSGAIFSINGGFFEIDSQDRLSPSGYTIVNGQQIHPYQKAAGSGLLYVLQDYASIGWSKEHHVIDGAKSALQSGPMIVDPGGKNGIYKNNFNRLNRAAVCAHRGEMIFFVTEGGLSLYELGHMLSSPTEQGGFECERAMNLDGGPSRQASFRWKSEETRIDGIWKIQNAISIIPR
ncbi:MAG: phosphodiester glycosidase family protein [Pseudomonadota bacterium]